MDPVRDDVVKQLYEITNEENNSNNKHYLVKDGNA